MAYQIIWFILWSVLWAVYFMLDGFDFGVGILYPFVAKNEGEKSSVRRAIGPVWDGNEVWLITAGGATFAAFPTAYASMFSYLYSALLLILFSLSRLSMILLRKVMLISQKGPLRAKQHWHLHMRVAIQIYLGIWLQK